MSGLNIEELSKDDEIILWAGLGGMITSRVEAVRIEEDGQVFVTCEELEWADLTAPIGTEVELA
ncbi:hypothetical protein SAMN05216276_1008162 [Streptosporangium subroseum]|uniref:Uncharacterized protein n=1 Tax=Streptosporangium subroseum TaxID=106412 RepID=A0A239E2N3_9ACTN|nr:hypothetical protein [Streptosporangium subroseum]SNS38114.1 hypothetical protein SAMN05216276_1008162 [Streptosporangium subroseum]